MKWVTTSWTHSNFWISIIFFAIQNSIITLTLTSIRNHCMCLLKLRKTKTPINLHASQVHLNQTNGWKKRQNIQIILLLFFGMVINHVSILTIIVSKSKHYIFFTVAQTADNPPPLVASLHDCLKKLTSFLHEFSVKSFNIYYLIYEKTHLG